MGDWVIIEVPETPPSLNKWTKMHWAKSRGIKKRWEAMIAVLAKQAKAPKFSKANINITYYFTTNHRRDKDNYTPKFIMDGLVKAGVLVDDNTSLVNVDWKLERGDKALTVIEIKAVG